MNAPSTIGWVLAGGRSRRMGEDKAGLILSGRPLVAHVLERLDSQCAQVVVNAEPSRLPPGLTVEIVPDQPLDGVTGSGGPLAGMLTGLRWIERHRPGAPWLATVAVDTPFVPTDIVARLHTARGERPAICITSGGRRHPIVGLWHVGLADRLEGALRQGVRRAEAWVDVVDAAVLDLPWRPLDPLFNVNTPTDLETARRVAGQG